MNLPEPIDGGWNTPAEAEALGFATFNNVPHLGVWAPDGNFTITVKTSEGKLVTLAFLQYTEGGPAQCVDVVSHKEIGSDPHGKETPPQDVRVFSQGGTPFCHVPDSERNDEKLKAFPPVTTTVIFLDTEESGSD